MDLTWCLAVLKTKNGDKRCFANSKMSWQHVFLSVTSLEKLNLVVICPSTVDSRLLCTVCTYFLLLTVYVSSRKWFYCRIQGKEPFTLTYNNETHQWSMGECCRVFVWSINTLKAGCLNEVFYVNDTCFGRDVEIRSTHFLHCPLISFERELALSSIDDSCNLAADTPDFPLRSVSNGTSPGSPVMLVTETLPKIPNRYLTCTRSHRSVTPSEFAKMHWKPLCLR